MHLWHWVHIHCLCKQKTEPDRSLRVIGSKLHKSLKLFREEKWYSEGRERRSSVRLRPTRATSWNPALKNRRKHVFWLLLLFLTRSYLQPPPPLQPPLWWDLRSAFLASQNRIYWDTWDQSQEPLGWTENYMALASDQLHCVSSYQGRLTAVLHHSLSTDRCETGTASFPISPCAHSASEKITSSHSRLSFPAAFWGTVLVLYFWNTHHWPAVWLQRNLARIVFNFPIPRTRESIKKESHEGPGKVA